MFWTGFTWFSGLLPFPLLINFFVFVHGCWCYPLANVFVFKDFNFHHKNWPSYSGGSDKFGELCYKFSISNKLTQIVNFPAWKTILTVFLFWIYFYSLELVFIM